MWTNDIARRKKACVTEDVAFRTKPQNAIDQIRQAIYVGGPQSIVLADAGYGNYIFCRNGLADLKHDDFVGILGSTAMLAPGTEPRPARTWSVNGRTTKLLRPNTLRAFFFPQQAGWPAYALSLAMWTNDIARRKKACVTEDVAFRTKPQIAIDQIRQAIYVGGPQSIVLADAGYGNYIFCRNGLADLKHDDFVGILGSTAMLALGTEPRPARTWSVNGRTTKLLRRDDVNRRAILTRIASLRMLPKN